MPAFRLAHISDPHLPPPPGRGVLQDVGSKRLLSRIAWRRKRRRHSPAVLAAIVADLKAHAPDHVAITGDLTNFSTEAEYAAARSWLESLGPAEGVTVSPGNHDALVGEAGPARFAPWAPWLGDDGEAAFPQVRRRGPVSVINLCSAVPTPWRVAQGELGAAQLAALGATLDTEAGRYRVVLLHHPATEGVVSRRKSLRDQAALRDVLAAKGAELVLHGHAHEALLNAVAGPTGPIPVVGSPSASTSGGHDDPARWTEFAVDREGDAWRTRVRVRGVTAGGGVDTLGDYFLVG